MVTKKVDALAGELEEEVPEGAAGDGVDTGGGLVEEDNLGGVDDGAGEGKALLPSSGELGDAAGEVGLQTGEGEEFFDACAGGGGRQTVGSSVEVEVFLDGEVFVEAELLRHVADVALDVSGVLADVHAEDGGVAGGEGDEAAEGSDDGGFAGAVGAEEAEELAAVEVEADVVDGGEGAEAEGEVLGVDDGHCAWGERRFARCAGVG